MAVSLLKRAMHAIICVPDWSVVRERNDCEKVG